MARVYGIRPWEYGQLTPAQLRMFLAEAQREFERGSGG